jgi:hypothetical protein
MRKLRWMLALTLLVFISIAWTVYFYLHDLQDKKGIKEKAESEVSISVDHEASADTSIQQRVQDFCTILYTKTDAAALKPYVTNRGAAEIFPPGEGDSKLQAKMKVHNISVYSGTIKQEAATVIAAVNRTVTIKGIETTSTHYIRIELKKSDTWRIDSAMVLADIPASK